MIPIKNVYYMLSYAFQVLKKQGYRNLATEHFANTAELMATILAKGIAIQLKRGLDRKYIEQTETLSSLRGRLEISESIKAQTLLQKQFICTYDDFSVNNHINCIIKSTVELLLRADISKQRKKELRKLMVFFCDVQLIDLNLVNWNIRYNKSNQGYHMLISVCYLVVKGLLQTNSAGSVKLMDFLDEQRMCRLYEKFILEYYKREFPYLKVKAAQIPWALDDGVGALLPVMQSDITLQLGKKVLIIDAKYYTHTMQMQYNKYKIHSNNLYQIFAYVKNYSYAFRENECEVAGMLLYAKTDEENQPNQSYHMHGNKISVRTLDLNKEFSEIAAQLNCIAKEHFSINI